MKKYKPILLTGCTASGKSNLAKELAALTPSIIINADALQVYECWKIISARPTQKEMDDFKHVLYGHVNCSTTYNVASWLDEVQPWLRYARDNELRPIIVGGTGLYFSLLTEGISKIPPISTAIREKSNKLLRKKPEQLLSDLKNRDFETFVNIDHSNFSRIQRAWEVLHETGKGITFWQKDSPPPTLSLKNTIPVILDVNISTLETNIEKRFKKMVDLGVIDEIKEAFKNRMLSLENKAAFRAIGVKEIKQFIDRKLDLKGLEDSVIIKTRQYAKRQRTWFRNKFKGWKIMSSDQRNSIKELSQSIENIQ